MTDIGVGDEIGPERRVGPDAEGIAAYVHSSDVAEPLFRDLAYARGLGYRGVVVPGPMLTAFVEQFLRRALTGWRIERLSTTFRVPTISGDPFSLRGVIVEHHHMADAERIVCEVVIEHADGERAVTGTATLRR